MKQLTRLAYIYMVGAGILFLFVPHASFAGELKIQEAVSASLPFQSNVGQYPKDVLYGAELMPGQVYVTGAEIRYGFPSSSGFAETPLHGIIKSRPLDKTPTVVNYFIGNDASKWKTNVETFGTVSLGEIFKGVIVDLKAKTGTVEKIFNVNAYANPGLIRFRVSKNVSISTSLSGELLVKPNKKDEPVKFAFSKPVAYQIVNGEQRFVDVSYFLYDKRTYGFKVGKYEKNQPLIIDPEFDSVVASTNLGGASAESQPRGVVLEDGSFYFAGQTQSTNLPTSTGAYGGGLVGTADVFVARFSDTKHLTALTYIGSPGQTTAAAAMLLDSQGRPVLYGSSSGSFPTTPGAFRTTTLGAADIFITKFSVDLTSIVASTLYGSSAVETPTSIKMDANGDFYVYTRSGQAADIPTAGSPFSAAYAAGGATATVIAKFSADLSTLMAFTFLQGNSTTFGDDLQIDSDGNIWVTGQTAATNFPTTSNAFQISKDPTGSYDMYITKFNSALSNVLLSTYLGGAGDDVGDSIGFDASGNVYVFGTTNSTNFPNTTSTNGYQKVYGGGSADCFIVKLNAGLTSLLASTYLGGTSGEFLTLSQRGSNLVVNRYASTNEIYVYGEAPSTSTFPTTAGAYQTVSRWGSNVVFISKLTDNLQTLLGSTLLNGSSSVNEGSFRVMPTGIIYQFGYSSALNNLPYINAFQSSNAGSFDIFIGLFASTPSITSLSPNSVLAGSATTTVTINGSAFAPSSTVQFNSAALTSVVVNSSTQITVDVPSSLLTSYGTSTITVSNGGVATSSAATFTVNNDSPAILELTPSRIEQAIADPVFTITGSGFNTSTVVTFDGASVVATLVNSTTLSVALNSSNISTLGDYTFGVANPSPGGGIATTTLNVFSFNRSPVSRLSMLNSVVNQNTGTGTSSVFVPTTATIPDAKNAPSVVMESCSAIRSFTKKLMLGTQNSEVKLLQRVLNCLGFSVASTGPGAPGKETSYFGARTLKAVVLFQKQHLDKLFWNRIGTVGSETRKILNSLP